MVNNESKDIGAVTVNVYSCESTFSPATDATVALPSNAVHTRAFVIAVIVSPALFSVASLNLRFTTSVIANAESPGVAFTVIVTGVVPSTNGAAAYAILRPRGPNCVARSAMSVMNETHFRENKKDFHIEKMKIRK